jgi:hypothetical protein
MSDDLIVNARVTIPAAELEFTASRGGGPRGPPAPNTPPWPSARCSGSACWRRSPRG